MATAITISCRFSDGSWAYLQNADVTAGATGEVIQTSNASNFLNQTSGVDVGAAFVGKVCTHAGMKVEKTGGGTASYLFSYFIGSDGAIITPIQGGGGTNGMVYPLYKPVQMVTGIRAWGAWQDAADDSTLVASLTVCAPNKCDVFTGTGVDVTAVELTNKDGASVGDSMGNSTAAAVWGIYPSTVGLNNSFAGVSTLWVQEPDGQIGALIPPGDGGPADTGGQSGSDMIQIPVRFSINSKAYVATDT